MIGVDWDGGERASSVDSGGGAMVIGGRGAGLATVAALVLAGCTSPAAPQQQARGQATVTITTNGARSSGVSGDETAATCARFRLSAADVTAFFAQARPVDARAYNHDLDMSPCYAAGTIRLADGEGGAWTIDEARRGQLVRRDGVRRYLYCATCSSPPFDEVGEGEVKACCGASGYV